MEKYSLGFLVCSLVSGFSVLFVFLFCFLWVFDAIVFFFYLFLVADFLGLVYLSFVFNCGLFGHSNFSWCDFFVYFILFIWGLPPPSTLNVSFSSPCSSAVDQMYGIWSVVGFRAPHSLLTVCQEGLLSSSFLSLFLLDHR